MWDGHLPTLYHTLGWTCGRDTPGGMLASPLNVVKPRPRTLVNISKCCSRTFEGLASILKCHLRMLAWPKITISLSLFNVVFATPLCCACPFCTQLFTWP